MRTAVFLLGLLLAAGASAAEHRPQTRVVCLDVGGQTLPAVCKRSGGRLEAGADICSCPQGRAVEAPMCAPGEQPPAESLELEKARRDAARDGSLVGDRFRGRSFCALRSNP